MYTCDNKTGRNKFSRLKHFIKGYKNIKCQKSVRSKIKISRFFKIKNKLIYNMLVDMVDIKKDIFK